MTAAVRRPVWHKNSKPVQNNPLHILIYVQMLFALQLKWQTAALDQQEMTGTLLPSGENKNFFAEATNLLSLHSYFPRENLCAPFCWLSGAFMQRNIRDVNVLTVWWTCWHFQPSGWISGIKGISPGSTAPSLLKTPAWLATLGNLFFTTFPFAPQPQLQSVVPGYQGLTLIQPGDIVWSALTLPQKLLKKRLRNRHVEPSNEQSTRNLRNNHSNQMHRML